MFVCPGLHHRSSTRWCNCFFFFFDVATKVLQAVSDEHNDDNDDDDDDGDDGDGEGDNDDDDDDDDDNDGAATKVSQAFPRLHNSAAALSMIAASSAQKYVYKYS